MVRDGEMFLVIARVGEDGCGEDLTPEHRRAVGLDLRGSSERLRGSSEHDLNIGVSSFERCMSEGGGASEEWECWTSEGALGVDVGAQGLCRAGGVRGISEQLPEITTNELNTREQQRDGDEELRASVHGDRGRGLVLYTGRHGWFCEFYFLLRRPQTALVGVGVEEVVGGAEDLKVREGLLDEGDDVKVYVWGGGVTGEHAGPDGGEAVGDGEADGVIGADGVCDLVEEDGAACSGELRGASLRDVFTDDQGSGEAVDEADAVGLWEGGHGEGLIHDGDDDEDV